MSSLLRLTLASLLCGMIVLGQAPSWLHVGSCEGHGHAQFVSVAEETATVCSQGCQHHAQPPAASEAVSASQDLAVSLSGDLPASGDQHQHDSETCVICQSLASPGGVTWELLVSHTAEFVSQPVLVATESVHSATPLSIPQPRGPPA